MKHARFEDWFAAREPVQAPRWRERISNGSLRRGQSGFLQGLSSPDLLKVPQTGLFEAGIDFQGLPSFHSINYPSISRIDVRSLTTRVKRDDCEAEEAPARASRQAKHILHGFAHFFDLL